MSTRQDLFLLLRDFSDGKISVGQLKSRLESLLNQGLREALTAAQRKKFQDFYTWYADMYDERLRPHSGWIGRIKDIWAQTMRGEYRVPLTDVQKKAKELSELLQENPENPGRF